MVIQKEKNNLRVLIVADRLGWAIDRLAKPVAEKFDNVDLCYFWTKPSRYLDTGYSKVDEGIQFDPANLDKYDVVHFHKADAVGGYINSMKARKIVTKHTEVKQDVDWSKFDDVICPTKYVYDEMGEYDVRRHYVPTGIDIKKYNYSFTQPKENTVGYVGRVIDHKRIDLVLNACMEAKLRMIGCGYWEHPRLLDKYHINEKVAQGTDYDFITFLPEDQMPGFYAKMNLFICMSEPHIETGPLPIMEALACGIPVITTPVGWAKDHLTHEKNVFFIQEDETDYKYVARKLRDIYDRPDIRGSYREKGLQLIKNFSLDIYCDKLMSIYEERI